MLVSWIWFVPSLLIIQICMMPVRSETKAICPWPPPSGVADGITASVGVEVGCWIEPSPPVSVASKACVAVGS
jgi:hypothetical protein